MSSKNNIEIQTQNTTEYNDIFVVLSRVLKLAKRHIVKVICIVAAFAISFLAFSITSYTPIYKTNVTFSITPLVLSDSESGLSVYKFNYVYSFADQMNKTFPHIVSSDTLRDTISYDLGRPINGRIIAEPISGSNIFKVTVTSSSPTDANDIMQSFIKCYPNIAEHIIGDTRIKVIHSSGIPTQPYNSPSHVLHVAFGMLAGLLVSFVIFYIMATYSQTIKDKNDINIKLNSHYICEIPHINIKRSSTAKSSLLKMSSKLPEFSEAMRVLKKRVTALLRENEKIIAITSTTIGEGKTTLSYNLAQVLANGNSKTLLIDMNLFNKTLQNVLLKEPEKCLGLSDVAVKNIDLKKAICNISENFDILFAGSSECRYNNKNIAEIFKTVKEEYDYIIVDMPPSGIIPDVALITDLCDNIIFTVKADDTGINKIKRALQYILYSKARLIGFVINSHNTGSSYGYGGYTSGYGYRSRYRYRSHYRYGRYSSYGYGIDSVTEPRK